MYLLFDLSLPELRQCKFLILSGKITRNAVWYQAQEKSIMFRIMKFLPFRLNKNKTVAIPNFTMGYLTYQFKRRNFNTLWI